MRKTFLLIIIVIIVIGALMFFSKRQTNAPTIDKESDAPQVPLPTPTAKTPTTRPTPAARIPITHTIIIADGAVSRSVLNIKVGDTVTFVNNDSNPHWPAAGAHPVHNICPTFDPKKSIQPSESYSHTFMEAKTCPFHDHVDAGNSNLRGQIVVEP